MTFNWAYASQQLLMAAIAGALGCTLAHCIARLWRGGTVTRLWLEAIVCGAALLCFGLSCFHLGYGYALPGRVLSWTVAVALLFYWLAAWWPLRVALAGRTLTKHGAGRVTLATAAAAVLVATYAAFIEPQWLDVDRRELTFAEVGERPIRVAHISDMQLVDLSIRDRELVDAVNAFDPHLIVGTGDYIASTTDEDTSIAAARWVLSRLRARHGIYVTTSDSDNEEQRQRIFRGLGLWYHPNHTTTVDVEGVAVRIGVLDHRAPEWQQLAAADRSDELFLVACHTPDFAEAVAGRLPTADLFLCGHTHGGQINVPGIGPLVTFTTAPRHIAAGGIFHTESGMEIAVSRGIGMEGGYSPRFRFNCRPHVMLLTLTGRARSPARAAAAAPPRPRGGV